MKVLQTIAGFSARCGGTSTCTYDLLSAMHGLEPEPQIDILTPDKTLPDDSLMGVGEDWIHVVPNDCRTPLGLSANLTRYLRDNSYDIYHTNGLWMHINHATCSEARRRGKPYVITPHGMLYPEALARSAWKKWPMRQLWFNRDVKNATCIHATCEAEMNHIRAFGYNGPIALIGNPVHVPEYTAELGAKRPFLGCNRPRKLGFLGRLHPRKKAESLLYGVALAKDVDSEVYIMGRGSEDYERFLRAEAARLGIENRVHFLGFVQGADKFAQLAQLDALFVPSDMENFGMIIPEALIVGTPVMASLGTPWQALNTERCGWWTDNSAEAVAEVIHKIDALSPEEHKAMGQRGREYILNNFAAHQVASQMLSLYKWLAGEGDKPEFVYE